MSHSDRARSLVMQPEEVLKAECWGDETSEGGRRTLYETYWRCPGTRCDAIMSAIEAGESDEAIARRYDSFANGERMCTARDIHVYRLAYSRMLGLPDPPRPDGDEEGGGECGLTKREAEALRLWESGMGFSAIQRAMDMTNSEARIVLYYRLDIAHRARPGQPRRAAARNGELGMGKWSKARKKGFLAWIRERTGGTKDG